MTKPFSDYAAFYDLLYRDKNYAQESRYISDLLKRYCDSAINILDVGCGTGRHGAELAALGYRISGVDESKQMVEIARQRLPDSRLQVGRSETFRFQETFDGVISLFHVMSYHTKETNVAAFMKNVFHHLKPGGIFIFDFWNAPAVLKDPPRSRKKEMEDSVLRVVRTSYPTVDKEDRCVSVHFNIKVEEKRTKKHFAFEETHLMRYWHAEELVVQGETNGFRSLDNFRFLYTEPISDSDWNGLCIFQKP